MDSKKSSRYEPLIVHRDGLAIVIRLFRVATYLNPALLKNAQNLLENICENYICRDVARYNEPNLCCMSVESWFALYRWGAFVNVIMQ